MTSVQHERQLKELAIELIDAERPRLAKAIARQIQLTVPRYAAVDFRAMTGNTATVLSAVRALVLENDVNKLAHIVEDVARLRIAGGFDVAEFTASGLCFLPVLRRFLVMKAGDVAIGLEMYEHIESVVLPFVGRCVTIFLDSSFDTTDPESFSRERFLSMFTSEADGTPPFGPVPVSLVDDWDDDAHEAATPPMGQRLRPVPTKS